MLSKYFSPKEVKIIRIVGKRKVKMKEIMHELYAHEKRPPTSINVVGSLIVRINKKCKYHNLPWYLAGKGLGREGKTVWRVKNGER